MSGEFAESKQLSKSRARERRNNKAIDTNLPIKMTTLIFGTVAS